jgi:hypothetical protein
MMRRLQLLAQQVLGINRRNQELITRYNPRSLFQVVDHKVKTKEALSALGVPVVDTLAVYRFQYDLRRFASESRGWREFVVKRPRRWRRRCCLLPNNKPKRLSPQVGSNFIPSTGRPSV